MNLTASIVSPTLTDSQLAALRALVYYNIFNYPLTADELGFKSDLSLDQLVEKGWIYRTESYYSLTGEFKQVVRRNKGNQMAKAVMEKAIRRARFIFQFPFVRGVYISGSLSKGFLAEDGDVDFFVVTAPKRLWLSRSILILFKKVFLFNSHKFFCLNYFIDSEHLEIEEKNIFTATELTTLLAICDQQNHEKFAKANEWTKEFFPTTKMKAPLYQSEPDSIVKRVLEFVFSGFIGAWLDKRFMKLTVNHWKRKFADFEPKDFDVALKSRSYVSKHHPNNFQSKVLKAYQKGLEKFKTQHGIDLNDI